MILPVAGGVLGSIVAPGIGTGLGAELGAGLGAGLGSLASAALMSGQKSPLDELMNGRNQTNLGTRANIFQQSQRAYTAAANNLKANMAQQGFSGKFMGTGQQALATRGITDSWDKANEAIYGMHNEDMKYKMQALAQKDDNRMGMINNMLGLGGSLVMGAFGDDNTNSSKGIMPDTGSLLALLGGNYQSYLSNMYPKPTISSMGSSLRKGFIR